ncbi:espin-like protein [Oryzias melastigma]|uniref:espin-like protein n=1 Tax=Oryzias melastigma TaxID=30732 RepID=UPI000CF7FF03|nr:espin-like protein [Oryzias melastigma]
MTEADLNRIEKQIENLQVMHKVSEVEKELEELERQLHQLLPVSAALSQGHFSVNPKQVHGQAEDLPAWCSKISTLLKSMAILLATLGGKEIDILDYILQKNPQEHEKNVNTGQSQPSTSVSTGIIGRSQSFSTREEVEKEIKQCGVSVKNLKANYEVQNQPQSHRTYKRKRSLPVVSETTGEAEFSCSSSGAVDFNTNGHLLSEGKPTSTHVEEPLVIKSYAPPTYVPSKVMAPTNMEQFSQTLPSDPILNYDQLTRSLEVQTDLSYVQECIEMRKERIVLLFLEHWRKYTVSESYQAKYMSRRGSHLDVGWEGSSFNAQLGGEMQSEDDKLLLFMKSKQVVGNLISHWRAIMSQVPTRQIRRLSRTQMIYWPEHFLPHINGSPVRYESLTLDLFMLGYFQLLEMNMSRNERKFRHLLCYEMFDRLGSHKWEVIRQFHKEVMEDIERGKRDWADGFEDIKLKYFGDSFEGGDLVTISSPSMSPEISTMPPEESPPPPPSHPPPPPPYHNHSPNVHASSSAPELQSSQADASLTPSAAQNGVPEKCADSENISQKNGPSSEHTASKKPVTTNGTTSNQSLEVESVEQVQTPPQPRENSQPKKNIPPVTVKFVEEPYIVPSREEPTEDSIKVIYELKEFSNEEIIRYIDRSFAFWKQKEAELFDI